jgi:hypothetical protein
MLNYSDIIIVYLNKYFYYYHFLLSRDLKLMGERGLGIRSGLNKLGN